MKTCVLTLMLALPALVIAQEVAEQPVVVPAPISVGMHVGDFPSGYDDGGRRDPFATLVQPKRAVAPGAGGRVRPGLAGMALADVSVRGIVRSGTVMFAILELPGKQSYVARVKDKLLDATVQSIDAGGVVFLEQDGSGSPAAKVRKPLRSSADDTGEEDR